MAESSTNEKGNPKGIKKVLQSIGNFMPNANIWNAVATVFLVIVGIWGIIVTKRALELNERAWIAPLTAQLTTAPENGSPLHFIIAFINSGRQPARDVTFAIQNAAIDSFDPLKSDMYDIVVPPNTSCANLVSGKGRVIIPPVSTGGAFSNQFDTIRGSPPFYADDRILNGSKFYVVRGCVAYNTYETIHRTAYCYVLQALTQFQNPPQGQVPPNVANGRAFVFATCAGGFDAD